ncbi:hypothetical protein [Pseudooceanicola aestuarii]|uniref:hypothetical protein n=1 Tax=Pseudooceanicola aestuarii TaxID=2697319 RepID=UPI0013D11E82|nr:hypothetical protein [Pseudooceanicola aestuarii]
MTAPQLTTTSQAAAEALIDRLARVLRDEIAAIGQGNLAEIEVQFPRKQQLLAEVEAAFADPAPLLEGDSPRAERLRAKLSELRDLLHQDMDILRRMTEATASVAREIERIRDRHSLRGLYDRDGSAGTGPVAPTQRFDQSV